MSPRSLVGYSEGAKKRAARRWVAAQIEEVSSYKPACIAEWVREARKLYRVGQRLRPCRGCPGCISDERRLRRVIERPERVCHWGRYYTIVPRFLPTALGDGRQWIVLSPLSTRPNYYVCRIDSKHNDDASDEWLDDLYNAIEDYFGRADTGDEEEEEPIGWPALDLCCGSSWCDYEWQGCDGSGVLPARRSAR